MRVDPDTIRQWRSSGGEGHARTESSGITWRPTCVVMTWPPGEPDRLVRDLTPTNEQLLRWAARPKNQPPQSWWDETDDPFAPEPGR